MTESSGGLEQYRANQYTLARLDRMEGLYSRQNKKAERCVLAGKVAIVTVLASAGLLVTRHERSEAGKLGTEAAAIAFAVLAGAIGYGQADERRQQAGDIAQNAVNLAAEQGIDPPSWSAHGVRQKQEYQRRIDQMTGRSQ